jgi:4-amino-4-deoxy-L-arabinose transferase-like glycosyltransferase
VAALAVAVLLLYGTRLGESPIYLMHDESKFALQAQAIASTGHDLTGHFMPVYFTEAEFPAGRDPIIVYATALGLKLLPLSEWSVRLPTAIVGVVDVVLMFLLTRTLFGGDWIAVCAALLLALTPGHFMRSRLVLSPVFALPFVLAWLWSLADFSERGGRRQLITACAWLGVGMYSYLACMVMMPVYLALTVWLVARRRAWPFLPAAALGFTVPLVPMAAWYATHAERYSQIVDAYRLFNAGQRGTEALPSLGLMDSIKLRLDLCWSFFSPEFLFLSGHPSLIDSTRTAGVFSIALAVFIPVGAYVLARGRHGAIGLVMLIGLLVAPLATVISGHLEMNRVLFVMPFGVLVAVYGFDAMRSASTPVWRWTAMALLATVPLQFAVFYRDYMNDYRTRSSTYFGGNIRDAISTVLARQGPGGGTVYLSRRIPFAERYWRFYALAYGSAELVERAEVVDPTGLDAERTPSGSDLLCAASDASCRALTTAGRWVSVYTSTEPDGTAAFAVYEHR